MIVAVLTVDQRSSRTSADRVPEAIAALAALPVLVPFERTAGTGQLFAQAQRHAGALGFEVGEAFVGGGSDGNFTAPMTPTLDGLGAPGDGAHAAHEHVRLDRWQDHTRLLAALIAAPGVD